MTRLASILGVATVATLVLLSGCEQAMQTDHVEDLEGTWTITDLPTMVMADLNRDGQTDPTPYSATTNVEVVIAAADKLNTGEFTVSVVHTITMPRTALPTITATGSIVVDSSSIDVTVDDINAGPVPLPPDVQALEGEDIEIGYAVTDDTLVITSTLLVALQVALPTDPNLTLTRSAME